MNTVTQPSVSIWKHSVVTTEQRLTTYQTSEEIKQEPLRGYNRVLKITVTHTVRLRAMRNTKEKTEGRTNFVAQ